MRRMGLMLCLLCCLMLCGCGVPASEQALCTVVFEDHDGVHFTRQVFDMARGSDLTVTVGVPGGQRIASVSYPDSLVSARVRTVGSMDEYEVTLCRVRYPASVRLTLAEDRVTVYHLGDETRTVAESGSRLRINTLRSQEAPSRPGMLAIGWSREPEGGEVIGFGSRYTPGEDRVTELYPVYLPCTDERFFQYVTENGEAVVTGYTGSGDLIFPETLGGLSVTGIATGAFGAVDAAVVAFPPTLRSVAAGAFASLCAEELILFDGLTDVSDAAFGSLSVKQLRLQAMQAPVWCGSYFDTFTEKMDRLMLHQAERKLVLFCGSSARFGYDSAMLESAFPAYRVVNMGVYAYANMRPQAELILPCMQAGDVLLSSPELDAIDCQFCGETTFDRELFAMVESDYDLLSGLNLRGYTGVFDAFAAYQQGRSGRQPTTYDQIPAHYDEDGAYHTQLTYNAYGDYILHRENNLDRRLFGVKRACYNAAHIREQDWAGLNAVYDAFAAQGVEVLFAYSPRSAASITPNSDENAIAALDAVLRERLHARVISDIADSLMDALYFCGTDNHLSSEGVGLHTQRVIDDLRRTWEVQP